MSRVTKKDITFGVIVVGLVTTRLAEWIPGVIVDPLLLASSAFWLVWNPWPFLQSKIGGKKELLRAKILFTILLSVGSLAFYFLVHPHPLRIEPTGLYRFIVGSALFILFISGYILLYHLYNQEARILNLEPLQHIKLLPVFEHKEESFIEDGLTVIKTHLHEEGKDPDTVKKIIEERQPFIRTLQGVLSAINEIELLFTNSYDRGDVRKETYESGDLSVIRIPSRGGQYSIILATKVQEILLQHLKKIPFPPFSECDVKTDEPGTFVREVGKGYTWVIDPIDGSRHFRRKLPLFTTSIALQHEGKTLLGVIYAPVTRELFFAVKECGAYLNDWSTRLQVSEIEMGQALVHIEFPHKDLYSNDSTEFEKECEALKTVLMKTKRVRGLGLGTLGLAYVAKGSFEAYITFPGTSLVSDVAAGILLVKEAKGQVKFVETSTVMKNGVRVIASNKEIHQELIDIVKL